MDFASGEGPMSEDQRCSEAPGLCPVCGQLLTPEEISIVDDRSGRRSHVACWCQTAMWGPGEIVADRRTGAARAARRRSRSAPREEVPAPDAADLLIVALKRAGERARYVTIEADDELAGMIERLSESSSPVVAGSGSGRPVMSMRGAAF